jgi:hypothetical protein
MTAVAEGVETEGQLLLLRRLGCPRGQGHLWSPAVPAGDAEVLLFDPEGPLLQRHLAEALGASDGRSSVLPPSTLREDVVVLAAQADGAR